MSLFRLGPRSGKKAAPKSSGSSFLPPHLRSKKPDADSKSAPPPDRFIPSPNPSANPSKATRLPTPVRLSLDSLSSAQASALELLPAAASTSFRELWTIADGQQGKLLTLLETGVFAQSKDGVSAAESLRDLTKTERASGLNGEELTHQTIDLLTDSLSYQGDRYSCGAASLQVKLSEERPGELAYLIEDLTDHDGRTNFGDEPLTLQPNSLGDDGSGRNTLDRTLQSAFMAFAGSARGTYNVLTDKFSDNDKGLKGIEIARLCAAAEGEEMAVLHHNSKTYQTFRPLLKSTPEDRNVLVGVSWNDQDHILTYRGKKDGKAKFFDTQTGAAGEMPLDDFLFKVQFAIFPESKLDGLDLPEEYVERTSEPSG